MTKQEFTLTKDLEALVNNCNAGTQLHEIAKSKPSVDEVDVRDLLSRQLGDSRYLTMSPAQLLGDLRTQRTGFYRELEVKLDDNTYKAGIGHYSGALSPEVKAVMYAELITKEGIIPKKPSDDLKKVIGQLRIAEAIEKELEKGNVREAVAIADRLMANDQRERLFYNDAGSGAAYERFKQNIVADVARVQREQAYNTLSAGKLYAEIDGAVKDVEYGRAKTFTAAHNAYVKQQEQNEEKKAEAAKKAKK